MTSVSSYCLLLFSGKSVLLVGAPGTGKTRLAIWITRDNRSYLHPKGKRGHYKRMVLVFSLRLEGSLYSEGFPLQ